MKRLFYLILVTLFLTACGGKTPEPKKDIKEERAGIIELESEDEEEEEEVSQEIEDENVQIVQKQKQKEIVLKKIEVEDKQEFKKVSEEAKVITKEIKEFNKKALEKYIDSIEDKEIKELIQNVDIAKLVEKADSVEELEALLKENTAGIALNSEQIEKILRYKMIKDKIESASDAESLKKVLETETTISANVIKELVKDKEELIKKVENQKVQTLKKIYARLQRNRELGLDLAFCVNASTLDLFVLQPVYYSLDKYTMVKKDSNRLFDEIDRIYDALDDYPDLILQMVGKTDERGSSVYNKDLGDRRWSGVVKQIEIQMESERYKGVSFGEECHSSREEQNLEPWWAKNRVTEFIWALK
ncbi:MAG: hypothetical protein GY786_13390 [Proteobacteria bacterium]|nr:hypothetical protein [Pseudomonadota bacterium]